MYARTTPMRHGLASMLQNAGYFTDCSSSDRCSCHQVHFRIAGSVVKQSSDRSMFRQVLMHPSERLMFLLPPRWIFSPYNRTAIHPFKLERPYMKWMSTTSAFLNGYVNKQNCRIWSEANPQVSVETPLHPEKLIVWCALWAGGIIGPYFFKNDEGHNVTVNGDPYRAMITNFFIPELNNHDVQELRFQQDGTTCHTARATIDLLKDTFGDRLISRFGPVNWPPRSCDLTPLDYFLWGYVKSLVYADKPQTLDHLEDNIRRVIADIRPQMLEKVIENWTSRLDYIRASRGSSMPEIIFKI
ncbi:putative transposable element [Trichonephila clavipes]|uniref:Putative transposable element n=1 Tax=Trichonephila clavipes TaxID=2585209 RepID=A0A8X6W2R9_TRICX|nr:putative transposable element [Trichonephila clavipes]